MAGALNTFGKSLLGGAIIGGGTGYLTESDDPETGALIGALTGAATAPVGALGSRLLMKTLPWLAKKTIINPEGRGQIRKRAMSEMSDVFGNDELTTDELRRRLQAYPHLPITLTDVGGENALARADIVSKVPGPARNQALGLFQERNRLQPSRLQDLTRKYLTPNLDARATEKQLLDQRQKDSKAAYDPAFFDPDPQTGALTVPKMINHPGLDPLLDRLDKTGAFKLAEEIAAARGVAPPVAGQPLSASQLDLIKRGLDRKINTAYASGDKTMGSELTQLKHEYVGLLDTAIPGYADARKIFSDYSGSLEAIQAGKEFDSRKWDSGELLDYYNSLDPSDQDFFPGRRRGALNRTAS